MSDCDYCGKSGQDEAVNRSKDPYARLVNGADILVTICNGCYRRREDEATDELNR